MRLIDADELIKELKSLSIVLNGKQIFFDDAKNTVLRIIEEQPTAYDIDKVVEELDTARTTNNGLKFELIPFDKVAEIVKHGVSGTETETIRDKAVKWNNNSSKRVPYEFIDYVDGKRDIGRKPKPSRS